MAHPVPLTDDLLERYGRDDMRPVARRRRRTCRHKDAKPVQVWRDQPHRTFHHLFGLRVIPTRESKTFRHLVQVLRVHPQSLVLLDLGTHWPPGLLFIGLEAPTVPEALWLFLSEYGLLVPQPLERRHRRTIQALLRTTPLCVEHTA